MAPRTAPLPTKNGQSTDNVVHKKLLTCYDWPVCVCDDLTTCDLTHHKLDMSSSTLFSAVIRFLLVWCHTPAGGSSVKCLNGLYLN
jgi:hypothetical protein